MRQLSILLIMPIFASAAMAQTSPQSKLIELQNSHIQANVPPEKEFNLLLTRELIKYFRQSKPQINRVDFQLLRSWQSPTQSGVGYPKYYAWVMAYRNNDQFVCAGAVRIKAIEKTRLEITHFLEAKEITKTPEAVATIFPAPLCQGILDRARKDDLSI